MQVLEQHFKMTDGFELFYKKWPASGQIERVILCLHGIEAHSGAFNFMGPQLAGAGAEVYALDRRGSGKSVEPGLQRGDASDFNRQLEDLNNVVANLRSQHSSEKLFLFGHSIGCAYALWFAAHYSGSCDGLVLAAPPVAQGFKLPSLDVITLPFQSAFEPHHMFDLLDL